MPTERASQVLSVATAGQYFGEQAVLFDDRRFKCSAGIVELSPDAAAFPARGRRRCLLPGPGGCARDKHGFGATGGCSRASSACSTAAGSGVAAVDAYAALRPALHPDLDSPRIDTAALAYAGSARLPAGDGHVLLLPLARPCPIGTATGRQVEAKPTSAKAPSWQPIDGKLLTLLRDGISDVSDSPTCLCL